MATEHEFKFVLSLKTEEHFGFPPFRIWQGYFPGHNTRIRRVVMHNTISWWLTFKYRAGGRQIEIECKVDPRDGEDLWEVCEGKIKKDRYAWGSLSQKWSVDFLREQGTGEVYFCLAEVELPESSPPPSPEMIPEIIRPFILYEVPLTDDRFSNKKLGDVEYARKLYNSVEKGVIDE